MLPTGSILVSRWTCAPSIPGAVWLYRLLRSQLSDQYNLGSREPNIQIWNVDLRGDRSLTLRHFSQQRRPLDESSSVVLEHVAYLWGFTVRLESQDNEGNVSLLAERMREKRTGHAAP